METNNTQTVANDGQQASSSGGSAVEHRIIALAKASSKGISDKDIQKEIPDLRPDQRAGIINKLLAQGYFDLFNQNGTLLYKLKDPSRAQKVKGADNEEKIVYSIIEEAGNKGIWIRDIRYKSNLILTQLNKILKILENKKLIKAVKSVSVQLSVEDMETILDTLLYDGKVERSVAMDGSHLYRAVESLLPAPGIVRMPCGVCPVFRYCNDVGSVNAKKCVYMKEWLE
ncbi:DNA-directed RNA polymerase III subunit RPC6 [Blattella germanica]|nr:DNA-directed RNA polymerase III subunit RPC6 [Blattella germanica]